jgi:hypothetical protein
MSGQLSREGLAVLELLPQWQLRPHLRAANSEPWGAECKALIITVVANDLERRLWANVGKAMQALGLHGVWAQSEVLASQQIEQAVQRVMQERPGVLLVFGGGLKKALLALQPGIETSCAVHGAHALAEIAGSAALKRALFTSLAQLKQQVH